ncbi:ATP-binding cassette subfamily C protein [Keratinibaculum paraultunense]|uniref:ATP-binding cassette subfamily C protein n=1 Tax=Keratinibaculum paraultunense TaxID=1278232 RepID=A0A4R3KNC0_9FIRM|nr:ABC transporter ATP-binding protein [Keratinibaculum paraultunense]QQY79070.1 ABC transporter ATP-binding protein [Keratinibaculum paraultunense]TCS85790.1 ATP-binding cassette subfamily C protein [Keratinibaculum paraultunense]
MRKLIVNTIRKEKYKFILITIISIFVWVYGLLFPYLNAELIDNLTKLKSMNIVLRIIYTIILLTLLNMVLSYVLNMQMAKLKLKFTYQIIYDVTEHLKRVFILFFSDYKPVYLSQRIYNDSNSLITFFLDNYLRFFTNLGTILFSFYMLFTINFKIFICSLVSIPFFLILYNYLKSPLYKWNLILKESQNKFFTSLSEQYIYIKDIKTNGSFNQSSKLLNSTFSKLLTNSINANRVAHLFYSLDGIITLLLQSVILVLGSKSILDGHMTIGQFTIILSYYSMIIECIKYYLNFGKSYQETKVSFNRINELYSVKKEHNGTKIIENINSVSLNDINYSYTYKNKKEPYIIKDFNYKFEKDKIYIIRGHNGSGKSTLIDIIIGLLSENLSGNVKYNNINIKEIDLYELRKRNIAVVQQFPNLMSDTVLSLFNYSDNTKENIKLIKNQIKELGLMGLFYNNHFDLDKFWFKKISELSGGENQRIAILHALLKRPSLLILDEPSSALDSDSVNELINILELNKLDTITIIVTHDERLFTICDEIINIDYNRTNSLLKTSS